MNSFIEMKNGKMIGLNTIKCIVKDEDNSVMVRTEGFDDEVLETDFELIKKNLMKYDFMRKTELVGREIGTKLVSDNGRPYKAIINLNLVCELFSNNEEFGAATISFNDGTLMESSFSYYGMMNSLSNHNGIEETMFLKITE